MGVIDWEFKGVKGNYIVKVFGIFLIDNVIVLCKVVFGGYGIVYVLCCLVYYDFCNGELVDVFLE